ncbi:MAG: ribosome maturation factor RimM [Desulfobacula sp.]|nr:ribosome maturation factor RimM [Desulfobacula sp.]
MNKNTSFTIGKVTGVHGLNGNLKVWSYAESVETFSPGRTVLLKYDKDAGKIYTINKVWPHKKGILLNLTGVDNRNLAEDLMGCDIIIDREQLPEPDEDSWYWEDLIGLAVHDEKKGFIGNITQIFPTGANDILVVTQDDQETLVPMHKQFVESVDLQEKMVKVRLPKGY